MICFYKTHARELGLPAAMVLGQYLNCGMLSLLIEAGATVNGKNYAEISIDELQEWFEGILAKDEIINGHKILAKAEILEVMFGKDAMLVRWPDSIAENSSRSL